MRKITAVFLGLTLCIGAHDANAQVRERTPDNVRERTRELPFPFILRSQGGRGWLGFSFDVVARARLPREDSAHVKTPAEAVIVKEVRAGSPAEKAGVMSGDTIINLNGLTANDRLINSLATFLEPGDTVKLRIRRAGTEREFRLIAEPRPSEFAYGGDLPNAMVFEGDSVRSMMRLFLDSARIKLDTLNFPRVHVERTDSTIRYWTEGGAFGKQDTVTMRSRSWKTLDSDTMHAMLRTLPGMRMRIEDLDPMKHSFAYAFDVGNRAIAGAELQDLTPELGEYFGVSRGVLVLRVGKGTPAAEAGLLAGDVISTANTTAITSIDQLRSAIAVRNKAPVKLQVVRKKKPVTVQLKGDR